MLAIGVSVISPFSFFLACWPWEHLPRKRRLWFGHESLCCGCFIQMAAAASICSSRLTPIIAETTAGRLNAHRMA